MIWTEGVLVDLDKKNKHFFHKILLESIQGRVFGIQENQIPQY